MTAKAELVWMVAASAAGDHDVFARLYAATRANLYGVLLRMLRRKELTEDVLQQSYAEIWRRAGEFDPRVHSPLPWMVAIAREEALAELRKRQDGSAPDEARMAEMEAGGPPIPPHAMSNRLRELLARLGRLEEDNRRVLLLAYYNGLSREQLADKFDTSVDVIKERLRAGLLQLRGDASA